ncbi:SLAM family member 7-like isoform X2 [Corvus moneduloides]|uniref:SLAM family member 7-like isoform X2 n=1 Tax=Corvus moneduloides TaxID=1196302 RepID=UPI0013646301|nr:SLAM family member 7-like isoform X2 [Corvus moneduloides]
MGPSGFWELCLALLCSGAVCADGTREVIGAVGASVTFPIQPPAGCAVFWTFGNDPIASVVPKDPPEVLFSEKKYKKCFTFPENGRALGISQLSLEDAGIYSVKIDGKTSTFTLRVYGELAEPTVTCEDRNCSAGSCHFSLRCSVPGTGLGSISYLWSKGEQPWDEGPTVLVVNESSWNEPESLTCTARNPVSSRNITVVAPGGLCEENATHPPGPGNVGALRAVPSAPPGWLCPLGDFGRAGVPQSLGWEHRVHPCPRAKSRTPAAWAGSWPWPWPKPRCFPRFSSCSTAEANEELDSAAQGVNPGLFQGDGIWGFPTIFEAQE